MSTNNPKAQFQIDNGNGWQTIAEAIDARVGAIGSHFRKVERLLTTLFERQMDLEAIIKQQQELLTECYETIEVEYGNGPAILHEITAMQQRATAVVEQTVK